MGAGLSLHTLTYTSYSKGGPLPDLHHWVEGGTTQHKGEQKEEPVRGNVYSLEGAWTERAGDLGLQSGHGVEPAAPWPF